MPLCLKDAFRYDLALRNECFTRMTFSADKQTSSDNKVLPVLREALYQFYNKMREGIHVSDLTGCIRKSVFKQLQPLPVSDDEINNFATGRGIHGAIEALVNQFPERFEDEKEIHFESDGIKVQAHIDVFDNLHHMPIELKTRKTLPEYIQEDKIRASERQQLRWYMALTGSQRGVLIRLYINAKTKENENDLMGFVEKMFEMSTPEIKAERKLLEKKACH